MNPDYKARRPGELTAPGGVDESTPPAPLPPHVQTEVNAIAASLMDAKAAHDTAVAQALTPYEAMLAAGYNEHMLAAQQSIGDIDSQMRAAAAPHFNAIVKSADNLSRNMIYAQEDLRSTGVNMPTSIDAVRDQLSESNPDAIINMLASEPFGYTTGAVADAVPAAPEPAPIAREKPLGQSSTIVYDQQTTPPIVPPPPPPPPPPESPPPPATKTPEPCPPKPCPPPAQWPRSQACPDAIPFYGYQNEAQKGLDDGTLFWDPYTNQVYFKGDCDTSGLPQRYQIDPQYRPGGVFVNEAEPANPFPAERSFEAPAPVAPPEAQWNTVPWDSENACAAAAGIVSRAHGIGEADRAAAQTGGSTVSAILRFGSASLRTFIDGALAGFSTEVKDASYKAHAALTGDFFGGFTTLIQSFSFLDERAITDKGAAWDIGLKLAIVNNAQTSTSFPVAYLAQSLTYEYQYANPQFIPDQAALDSLYLTKAIDRDRWICLTRAQGNLPVLHESAALAKRNRVDAAQIVDLWRRGFIPDAGNRDLRLKERGYMNDAEIAELVKVSEWLPAPPDVVRFMVRDVFDPAVVQGYNLDKDFEVKFYGPGGAANPGPAAAYAKAFGVSPDVFKLFWRAHWVMPSPTQLFQMLHRLRTDSADYVAWKLALEAFGTVPGAPDPGPAPPAVTPQEIRTALEVDDHAPAWIDNLMAISYNPMTRTDAINAFMAQVMDETELEERLRDTGLDKKTAKRVVELQKAMRARRISNVSGVWTIRKVLQAYKAATINGVKADQLLLPLVPDNKQRADMIQGADDEMVSDYNHARVIALRRQFIMGYYNTPGAVQELVAMGQPQNRAQLVVDTWDQEKRTPRREVTAKMIVEWVVQRILPAENAYIRLANLGYSAVDANQIVYGALVKGGEKVQTDYKKARTEVQAQIKSQRQAARLADKDLNDRAKELQKQMDALDKERVRIEGEIANRRA